MPTFAKLLKCDENRRQSAQLLVPLLTGEHAAITAVES
jgi:hypothetical protein